MTIKELNLLYWVSILTPMLSLNSSSALFCCIIRLKVGECVSRHHRCCWWNIYASRREQRNIFFSLCCCRFSPLELIGPIAHGGLVRVVTPPPGWIHGVVGCRGRPGDLELFPFMSHRWHQWDDCTAWNLTVGMVEVGVRKVEEKREEKEENEEEKEM